jgi:hypothetical protein
MAHRQREDVPEARVFSPLLHFPLSRKRFMVPPGFAIGILRLFINIKGLAGRSGLWRAV